MVGRRTQAAWRAGRYHGGMKSLAFLVVVAMTAFAADLKPVDDAGLDAELAKPGEVFLEISQSWCAPCQAAKAVLPGIAGARPDVRFLTLDSGKSARYGGLAVPTFILYKDGREIDRHTGYSDEEQLKQFVARLPR